MDLDTSGHVPKKGKNMSPLKLLTKEQVHAFQKAQDAQRLQELRQICQQVDWGKSPLTCKKFSSIFRGIQIGQGTNATPQEMLAYRKLLESIGYGVTKGLAFQRPPFPPTTTTPSHPSQHATPAP